MTTAATLGWIMLGFRKPCYLEQLLALVERADRYSTLSTHQHDMAASSVVAPARTSTT